MYIEYLLLNIICTCNFKTVKNILKNVCVTFETFLAEYNNLIYFIVYFIVRMKSAIFFFFF